MTAIDEHVRANRAYWDARAGEWVAMGQAAWEQSEPSWGIWSLPESDLQLLPADMSGMAAIELGCVEPIFFKGITEDGQ